MREYRRYAQHAQQKPRYASFPPFLSSIIALPNQARDQRYTRQIKANPKKTKEAPQAPPLQRQSYNSPKHKPAGGELWDLHVNASSSSSSMQHHALPTLTPAQHRIQGRIVIKPITCPQVGSSKVRNHVVVCDARQFLL